MLKRLLPIFIFSAITATGHAVESALAPRISDAQGVKVTVTPRDLSVSATVWELEVVLETHTRDLEADLARSSLLVAEGKQYPPIDWKGAEPGGHHRKGTLHFKAIAPRPRAVELQIRLDGESAPRSFSWSLNDK